MYYSKKLARLRANEFFLLLLEIITACQCTVASKFHLLVRNRSHLPFSNPLLDRSTSRKRRPARLRIVITTPF